MVASKVTDWSTNPLAYGSYSDWPLGYTEAQHNEMIAPHLRVHFGREDTDSDGYGYVHGAWETGRKQAKKLINLIYPLIHEQCKQCKEAVSESPCDVKECKKKAKEEGNKRLKKKCTKLCKDVMEKDKSPHHACKRCKFCK